MPPPTEIHNVDRAPRKSPAMVAAYEGLAEAERGLGEAHEYGYATDDWEPHHEATRVVIAWHAEIGRIAQARR